MKTPEDAYKLKLVSDPFVYGETVYFTLNWIESGEYRSSIYRFNGKEATRITFGGHEKNPKIHNGGLYFVSYNKEEESLFVQEELAEPRKLFTNKSISKYIFHRDGVLAITVDKSEKDKPFVTSSVKYRFDTTGFLRERKKLVSVLEEPPRVLASGDFDVIDVSSNGQRAVFAAAVEDNDRGLEDVYELDVKGGKYRKVTSGEGKAGTVCVASDGTIAYLGHRKGLKPWASSSLIFPEAGKEVEVGRTSHNKVTTDLFVSASESLVSDNGVLYLEGQEGGFVFLYSYDGTNVKKLTEPNRAVRAFHVAGGKVAYVYTSPEKPSVLSFNGEYDPNPNVIGHPLERIEVEGREAWLILSSKGSPTVLNVHGGPQMAYGEAYSIEFNFLADNGFNVLFGNPRGSDGYGEEFAYRCVGDWGGEDFQDLMKFMDAAKSIYGLKEEFAITGGSYGGFMTNAAITQTTRFKCAVAERCVSNLMSMCGTSDIGFWFNALESGVKDPWSPEGMEQLLRMSPITRVKSARTPTMFIHGEEDYRCPIEQSEQMYTALRLNGVDAVLARYPGDSHEHARRGIPKNMNDRLARKLEWFRKYMQQ